MRYQEILEACWKGYQQQGMKKKGDRQVPNCVPVSEQEMEEDLKKWFKEKWVRFGPDGKIRGDCARGSSKEGKPKCLPQAKAHALGKSGRASAAAKKRREDPDPERRGPARNVATKVKEVAQNIPPVVQTLRHIESVLRNFELERGRRGGQGLANDLRPLLDQLDRVGHQELATDIKQMMQGAARNDQSTKGMSWGVFAHELKPKIIELIKTNSNKDVAEAQIDEKQDACYRKVKSRYKVWPSAYASGALVQCRKKGAANWGTGAKKK